MPTGIERSRSSRIRTPDPQGRLAYWSRLPSRFDRYVYHATPHAEIIKELADRSDLLTHGCARSEVRDSGPAGLETGVCPSTLLPDLPEIRAQKRDTSSYTRPVAGDVYLVTMESAAGELSQRMVLLN